MGALLSPRVSSSPWFPCSPPDPQLPRHSHPHRPAPGRRLPGRWRACARVTKAGQKGQLGPPHHHPRATRPHGPPLVHCLTPQPPPSRPWSPKALPGRAPSLSPEAHLFHVRVKGHRHVQEDLPLLDTPHEILYPILELMGSLIDLFRVTFPGLGQLLGRLE